LEKRKKGNKHKKNKRKRESRRLAQFSAHLTFLFPRPNLVGADQWDPHGQRLHASPRLSSAAVLWRVGPPWQFLTLFFPQIRVEVQLWHKIRAPLQPRHLIGVYKPRTVPLSSPPPLPRSAFLVALAWVTRYATAGDWTRVMLCHHRRR
jgi:hypothetical protein